MDAVLAGEEAPDELAVEEVVVDDEDVEGAVGGLGTRPWRAPWRAGALGGAAHDDASSSPGGNSMMRQ